VGIGLVGWSIVSAFSAAIPDPSQIGPADIHASAAVACATTVGASSDGQPLVPAPIVDLEVVYDRTDLAPVGILRDAQSWGDVIEMTVDPGPAHALFIDTASATTQAPGGSPEPVSFGSIVYAGNGSAAGREDTVGEILGADQRPGRTIRIHLPLIVDLVDDRQPPDLGTVLPGMETTITLHHLDRFILTADIGSGEQRALAFGGRCTGRVPPTRVG
jgi:hypothetical protein